MKNDPENIKSSELEENIKEKKLTNEEKKSNKVVIYQNYVESIENENIDQKAPGNFARNKNIKEKESHQLLEEKIIEKDVKKILKENENNENLRNSDNKEIGRASCRERV